MRQAETGRVSLSVPFAVIPSNGRLTDSFLSVRLVPSSQTAAYSAGSAFTVLLFILMAAGMFFFFRARRRRSLKRAHLSAYTRNTLPLTRLDPTDGSTLEEREPLDRGTYSPTHRSTLSSSSSRTARPGSPRVSMPKKGRTVLDESEGEGEVVFDLGDDDDDDDNPPRRK